MTKIVGQSAVLALGSVSVCFRDAWGGAGQTAQEDLLGRVDIVADLVDPLDRQGGEDF